MDRPVPEGLRVHDAGPWQLMGTMMDLPAYQSGDCVRHGGLYVPVANVDRWQGGVVILQASGYPQYQAEVWLRSGRPLFYCS